MAISLELARAGPVHRFVRRFGAALILVGLLASASPVSDLTVAITHLRSRDGQIRFCLTSHRRVFPRCDDSALAIARSVPAADAAAHFEGVPAGRYAVAVIHDANGNGKLDTFLGIPREGFGFSRNPEIGFGPPDFATAAFALDTGEARQSVRMRYLF